MIGDKFLGRVIQEDQVVADEIMGYLTVLSNDWNGSFYRPEGCHIETGGPYRLELSDGSDDETYVDDVEVSCGGLDIVRFSGCGRPPR